MDTPWTTQLILTMKFRILLSILLFAGGLQTQAQETFQPKQLGGQKGIVYNQEFALGLRLHTNGWAIGTTFGTLKTYYLTKYIHFELGEIQHPKEYRQSSETSSPLNGRISRAFKYGKQNNLYVLRGAMGNKRYFSEKAKHKGVAMGISYELGATLGMLKPYYLELITENNRNSRSIRYSEDTANDFLNYFDIVGASSWTTGLGDLSIIPGANAKFAVHFDWGAFDEYLKSIEAGIMVDVFTRRVPIMVGDDIDPTLLPPGFDGTNNLENNQLFINLFVNLQFGKRW